MTRKKKAKASSFRSAQGGEAGSGERAREVAVRAVSADRFVAERRHEDHGRGPPWTCSRVPEAEQGAVLGPEIRGLGERGVGHRRIFIEQVVAEGQPAPEAAAVPAAGAAATISVRSRAARKARAKLVRGTEAMRQCVPGLRV